MSLRLKVASLAMSPGFCVWWSARSKMPVRRYIDWLIAEIDLADSKGIQSRMDELDSYVETLLEQWRERK